MWRLGGQLRCVSSHFHCGGIVRVCSNCSVSTPHLLLVLRVDGERLEVTHFLSEKRLYFIRVGSSRLPVLQHLRDDFFFLLKQLEPHGGSCFNTLAHTFLHFWNNLLLKYVHQPPRYVTELVFLCSFDRRYCQVTKLVIWPEACLCVFQHLVCHKLAQITEFIIFSCHCFKSLPLPLAPLDHILRCRLRQVTELIVWTGNFRNHLLHRLGRPLLNSCRCRSDALQGCFAQVPKLIVWLACHLLHKICKAVYSFCNVPVFPLWLLIRHGERYTTQPRPCGLERWKSYG
mmetsp:Transcript_35978/g.73973  ORF Transcript_35978/g.73973 Transcript_35978/m.73973 type:complete len:287 (-) Transcript_35978:184-1044(-)